MNYFIGEFFMTTMIQIIGAIIGGIFAWGGSLSLMAGDSGIGIIYGFITIFVAFKISSYYE